MTLQAFGDIYGIGMHKRDSYGEQFIAVIKEYENALKTSDVDSNE